MSADGEGTGDGESNFAWIRELRSALAVAWSDMMLIAARAESLATDARKAGAATLARDAEGLTLDARVMVGGLWNMTVDVTERLRRRQAESTRPRSSLRPPAESESSE